MTEAVVKVIFGVRGTGKTVKLRRLLSTCPRYVCINTLNRSGFSEGVVFHDISSLKPFWRKVHNKGFRIVYAPVRFKDEDRELYYRRLCDEVGLICSWALVCGRMTLAIEEMNVLFEGKRPPYEFLDVVYSGREPGVELIGVSQVSTGFGRAMRAMTKEAFFFYTHEQTDLDNYAKIVGREGADAINSLKDYQYVHWSYQNGPKKFTIEKDDPL
jgi:hypothetical protein